MTPSNLNLYAWQEMRRRQTLLAAARAMYAAAAGETGGTGETGETGGNGGNSGTGESGTGENGTGENGGNSQDAPVEEPKTLKIGDVEYKDFSEAFAAAEDGATIQLTDNTEVPATATVTKNVTIDLGGKNITADDCRAFYVTTGNLTLTGDGTIEINRPEGNSTLADSSSVIRVGSNNGPASLTIGEGVTVKSDYCYGVTYFGQSDISVTINGTVETTGANSAASGNGTSRGRTTLVIGKDAVISSANTYAIYNPHPGTTTIYGKVIGLGGVEAKSGEVIVEDGAVVEATSSSQSHATTNNGTSTTGYAIASIGSNGGYDNPARVTVKAGASVTGKVIVLAESGSAETGKITSDFMIEADEGCSWTEEDGKYKLVRA